MKNKIRINNLRNIKKALPRFISLMIMSLLGVFVFAGLQATSPDMINTIDKYLDDYNTYDIKIISDMGLIEEDIHALEEIEGIKEVEGSYSKDIIIKLNEDDIVINVSSLPNNINKLELLEGSLPINADEIVVEANMLTKNNLKIGDTITLDDEIFINKEVKIVGTVDSSLYFNNVSLTQGRGNTSIGTGTINYYTYILAENFDQNYYSSIYVVAENAKELTTASKDYEELIGRITSKIEEINEGAKTYQSNLQKYNENLEQYKDGLAEYEKNKQDAESKIADARKELEDIKHPTWYIYDRTDYGTYSDYIDDSTSIANLSKIFPIVFFGVAVLVSLISMNRMVEEDRQEIGTLKSLGFANRTIMTKYLLFSFLATVIGGIIGSGLGLVIIPSLIFDIYGMLFEIPIFSYGLNIATTILGFVIVVICVCGTTILTVYQVLKEKPSELMRPKAPKSGKRVLLENIKILWNHLKFSQKVTTRNLFRYKKRVIVTVGGIAGCTALMLCGFGIRDGIIDVANMQYGNVFTFDAMVYTSDLDEEKEKEIFNDERITNITNVQNISAIVKDIEISMTILESNESLPNIANLTDRESEENVQLETGKIVITDKFADLAGLNVGDTVEIIDVNNNIYNFEISAVVKNYLSHFIYMDKETYEMSGKSFKPNMVYLNIKDIKIDEEEELSAKLLENENILSVSFMSDLVDSADNMLESLNKVVVILIILAATLSFVVLYNLSNINVNERKREIATLKVLGFFDKEVDNYITNENIILTIIGIVIGLLLGYFLTRTVITSVEIEKARFLHRIAFPSYIYASALSVIFTWIVNIITHFNLKKINMIDSLKSVE